jgi:hypothetical protein
VVIIFSLAHANAQTELSPRVLANYRSRVVIAHDPEATKFFEPVVPNVRVMFDRAFMQLVHQTNLANAWLSLVSPQDIVGIKVVSAPGATSGTRPAVVEAITQGLLAAGIPADHIVIWDKHEDELRTAGFFDLAQKYGVRAIGGSDFGYDSAVFYETPLIGYLTWGDFEFRNEAEGTGRKSFVTRLLTQTLTKVINVTPLLNNNNAGVTGNLYSLTMGSVDNNLRFETEASRLARAVPEIYAMPQVGDHVVLNVTDALICQYEGGEHSMLHYSAVLNEIRVSRDPVALDVLSLDELTRQRLIAKAPVVNFDRDLYNNAALLELGSSDPDKITIERIQ